MMKLTTTYTDIYLILITRAFIIQLALWLQWGGYCNILHIPRLKVVAHTLSNTTARHRAVISQTLVILFASSNLSYKSKEPARG